MFSRKTIDNLTESLMSDVANYVTEDPRFMEDWVPVAREQSVAAVGAREGRPEARRSAKARPLLPAGAGPTPRR